MAWPQKFPYRCQYCWKFKNFVLDWVSRFVSLFCSQWKVKSSEWSAEITYRMDNSRLEFICSRFSKSELCLVFCVNMHYSLWRNQYFVPSAHYKPKLSLYRNRLHWFFWRRSYLQNSWYEYITVWKMYHNSGFPRLYNLFESWRLSGLQYGKSLFYLGCPLRLQFSNSTMWSCGWILS